MFVKRYQLPGLTTRRWLRTRPTPSPNPKHPPLHANNSAFLRNAEILFYLTRGYEQRRQTFHNSISNLSLNLNSEAHVWDWTMELCLPNYVFALTIIQYTESYNHTLYTLHTIVHSIHYIRSYVTYIAYNHTLHTWHTIVNCTHYIQLYITYECKSYNMSQSLTPFHTNHTHDSHTIIVQ